MRAIGKKYECVRWIFDKKVKLMELKASRREVGRGFVREGNERLAIRYHGTSFKEAYCLPGRFSARRSGHHYHHCHHWFFTIQLSTLHAFCFNSLTTNPSPSCFPVSTLVSRLACSTVPYSVQRCLRKCVFRVVWLDIETVQYMCRWVSFSFHSSRAVSRIMSAWFSSVQSLISPYSVLLDYSAINVMHSVWIKYSRVRLILITLLACFRTSTCKVRREQYWVGICVYLTRWRIY